MVNFFVVLNFVIIRLFRVIFMQSFTLDVRNNGILVKCTCCHLFSYGQLPRSNANPHILSIFYLTFVCSNTNARKFPNYQPPVLISTEQL